MRSAVHCCSLAVLLSVLTGVSATQAAAPATEDYSGLYSFLKDGEFVQITIEGKNVSGFISRYGESDTDKNTFLAQFFKSGSFEVQKLSFATDAVHGVWFTFDGTIGRGPAKKADDEGYYVVRGKLTRFSTGADNNSTSQVRQVEFKSFPRDTSAN
jgi:hypothetical protein